MSSGRSTQSSILVMLFGIACFYAPYSNSSVILLKKAEAYFDCSVVQPGSTVLIETGLRGPLTIRGCKGTPNEPILITKDPSSSEQVRIVRDGGAEGGFIFWLRDISDTIVDGGLGGSTGGSQNAKKGIFVSATNTPGPSSFVHISGFSTRFTIKGIEVDGGWPSRTTQGIGIQLNDHSIRASENVGRWRENIVISGNYVHDVEGEGMYIGPNFSSDGLPLRNIKIERNLVERTGWDGIQLKMAVRGVNTIAKNVVMYAGRKSDSVAGQRYGISLYESGGTVEANLVVGSGETGINHFIDYLPSTYGIQRSVIVNNIVTGSGATGPLRGDGISCSRSARVGIAGSETQVFNNTLHSNGGYGIAISNIDQALARDNLLVGDSLGPTRLSSTTLAASNLNLTPTEASFVDSSDLNFRIRDTSKAVNAASNDNLALDFDGLGRGIGGRNDVGAFEHRDSVSRPEPPTNVVIK